MHIDEAFWRPGGVDAGVGVRVVAESAKCQWRNIGVRPQTEVSG